RVRGADGGREQDESQRGAGLSRAASRPLALHLGATAGSAAVPPDFAGRTRTRRARALVRLEPDTTYALRTSPDVSRCSCPRPSRRTASATAPARRSPVS